MRRLRTSLTWPRRPLLAAAIIAVVLAASAAAYFVATGTATAGVAIGSVSPPTNLTAQQAGPDVTVSWNAASLSSGAAVQGYRVSRSDGATVCGTAALATSTSCTDTGVPPGSYTYTVTAVFNSFTATATSGAITILTAPLISQAPSDPTASSAASLGFSGGGGSGYECRIDAGSFTACSSPQPYNTLSDGSHTFKVHATSGSSTGPDTTYTWTIDTSAPAITAKPGNPTVNASPSFSFTHTQSAYTFKCRLDTGGYSACSSPQAYDSLADGSHTFQVEGIDGDGNATSVAAYTWSIDTTPPVTTIAFSPDSPNGSNGWYTTAPSFILTATDTGGSGVATTNYRIDAGTAQTYAGPVSIPEGQHTVSYWSTDNVGNVETQHTTAAIKVDTTAPTGALSLGRLLLWSNISINTIGEANLDGSAANQSFINGASAPTGVATDGAYVYWANANGNSIGRANLDGTGVNQSFITGAAHPSGVAVDGAHVYWSNFNADAIGRANLDGSPASVNQSFITGANRPVGVAVDAAHIYWTNFNGIDVNATTIGRANLDGSPASVNESFITGTSGPQGVAVDAAHVYWANSGSGTIGRANLVGDPATVNQSFITGASSPTGVTLDASHVYWANHGATTIGRASLDGSPASVNQSFITGASGPFGLAATPASAFLSGATLYYNGATSGSFSLTDAVGDSGSGPAAAAFPAIATPGWTHSAETVSAGSGSTPAISYDSNAFSWTASPSNPSGYTISSSDVAGNGSTTPLTFVDDTTPPTGGALSVNGAAASQGGSSSVTDSSTFTIGSRTDFAEAQSSTQSGLRSSTLTVQSEAMSGSVPGAGSCGAPGSGGPFTIPTTITSTTQPAGILAGYCYLYTLTGTDNVGNTSSISTTVTVAMKLWAVADTIAQGNGTSVTHWADSSAFANDLATHGTPPTYQANQWNGHAAVSFNGPAADLDTAQNMQAGSAPYDVFIVARPNDLSIHGMVGWGAANVGQRVSFRTQTSGGDPCFGLRTYWWFDDQSGCATVSTSQPSVFESSWDGTTRAMTLNGTSLNSGPGSGKNTVATPLVLGASQLSSQPATEPWNGQIAEAIVYEGVLSSAERTSIISYLKTRYAIP